MRSQCFLRSGGGLTCTTCHDPHKPESTETQYTRACRTCHAKQHEASTRDCAGCHMQKRRTEDAVHVVMTDHFIRRAPLAGDLLAPSTERHDRLSGPVKLLYPARLPENEAVLYTNMAQAAVSADPRADAQALGRAIADARPTQAEPYMALADVARKAGRTEEAIHAYETAIERTKDDFRPYVAISELLMGQGKVDRAIAILEPALKRVPGDSSLLNSLSVLYARERFDDALRLLSDAVRIDPDEPLSWLNLGVCLEAKGDRKGAAAAYRHALLLQPDFARAGQYLSRVSKN